MLKKKIILVSLVILLMFESLSKPVVRESKGNRGGTDDDDGDSGGGFCLGSKTIIMTDQGKKELNELRIGDRMLISNGFYSTVCHIRHHDKH